MSLKLTQTVITFLLKRHCWISWKSKKRIKFLFSMNNKYLFIQITDFNLQQNQLTDLTKHNYHLPNNIICKFFFFFFTTSWKLLSNLYIRVTNVSTWRECFLLKGFKSVISEEQTQELTSGSTLEDIICKDYILKEKGKRTSFLMMCWILSAQKIMPCVHMSCDEVNNQH